MSALGKGEETGENMGSSSFMERALEQARLAEARGEVPIGAVLVHEGVVIAADGNRTIELSDPTAHAEILVIRQACAKLSSQRLPQCDLYVTLEPCPMCAAAISFARIRRLYYAASDIKGGAVENGPCLFEQAICHHKPDIYSGFHESEAATLLKEFFKEKRD
ncbi:nucleoside deaminase [uncultured Cohaesibacter sp.]|uniref:nucleoside deaminase n=1 Tax=uncultured Cohaesibacter sp. TaxID=1002546 RepID=UPI00292E6767|nr:nucleoside deaminase [uncultured Cohaesibacter sp.]